MGLAPEKVLLKWMNFHLKKAGYKKEVTNFSSDVKVSRVCYYLTHTNKLPRWRKTNGKGYISISTTNKNMK